MFSLLATVVKRSVTLCMCRKWHSLLYSVQLGQELAVAILATRFCEGFREDNKFHIHWPPSVLFSLYLCRMVGNKDPLQDVVLHLKVSCECLTCISFSWSIKFTTPEVAVALLRMYLYCPSLQAAFWSMFVLLTDLARTTPVSTEHYTVLYKKGFGFPLPEAEELN